MEREEIKKRVIKIVSDTVCFSCNTTVTEESKFNDDLGADSLDEVELVMNIEDEFDIEIPDDDLKGIETVKQAIDYIAGRV